MKKLAAIGCFLLFAFTAEADAAFRPGWYVSVDTGYPPAVMHFTAEQQFTYYDGTEKCNNISKGEWQDRVDSVVVVTGWQIEYCPSSGMCFTPVPHLPEPECVWMRHDTLCYNWRKTDAYAQHFVYHSAPENPFPPGAPMKKLAALFANYIPYTAADPSHPAGTYYYSDVYEYTLLELQQDGTFRMKDTERHEKKSIVGKGSWQVKGDTLFLQNETGSKMQRLYFYKGRIVGELPANGEMPQYWVFYMIPPEQFKTNWKRG